VVAHAYATRQHQEAIEVEVGEELGGEVADRQAAGTLQGREQSVPGEPVDGGSGFRAVGQDPIQQPEGAGAGDALFQLMAQNGEIDAGKTPRNATRGRGSSWNPSCRNTSRSRNRTLSSRIRKGPPGKPPVHRGSNPVLQESWSASGESRTSSTRSGCSEQSRRFHTSSMIVQVQEATSDAFLLPARPWRTFLPAGPPAGQQAPLRHHGGAMSGRSHW
jgi:hypothetical protein